MKKKLCKKCGHKKLLNNFYKSKIYKDNYTSNCINCLQIYRKKRDKKNRKLINKQTRKRNKRWRLKNPLYHRYNSMQYRCNNPKAPAYKDYGGRGIKVLMTFKELKYLWNRDKAYNMKRPSIDRKNNDGHYEVSNCQFIEFKDNVKRRWNNITFRSYQRKTLDTLINTKNKDLLIARLALGVSGESGEVAEKVKKYLRGDYSNLLLKKHLEMEIGDILWYCSTLAHVMGLELEKIAKKNLTKLAKRKEQNKIKGSGDNR